ncbi:acetoacetate--CoA ligase [Embleya scabrispora]|uniref:Acetoacetate--CoA ligase n=1 Tax=Embleya scabrispora TaxID=159449 RepID=A0A1T3P5N0_9ACTN|nr:acetoacetate--CoA ligase [Embleya scabrispora]OPC84366.1 acetoacetate--CoA ligase [Embleya scabrispora]
MTESSERAELLWQPSAERVAAAAVTRYRAWLAAERGVHAVDYARLWEWSTTEPEAFWASLCDWFDLDLGDREVVLADRTMPGARWFPNARLNYAQQVLRHAEDGDPERPAIVHLDEELTPREISWVELRRQVASCAATLRELGVRPGDRVAAYVPNTPHAVIGLLACASIGAVWSACAPDFGARSVLDRFQQIEPVVLLAVDGYRYGGKEVRRADVVAELREGLPTVRHVLHVPLLDEPTPDGVLPWAEVIGRDLPDDGLDFASVGFDHPLWILYSSGTTGLPKAIVQGHGGIVLEHLKQAAFQLDLGPNDRFFWYTSTGWMMWNMLVGGLLAGSTIVLYDGSPGYPGPEAQWTVVERAEVTWFGTSAAYVMACRKKGLTPRASHDLSRVRALGTTGSPLPPDGFRWVYDAVGADMWLASVSGGTDVCSAFVGGSPDLPVYLGEIQCRALGCAIEAWDEQGRPVVDEVGELVITQPMPSMPIHFWNDPDDARYRASYFDTYPGVWRHGDWITLTERGTVVVHGRSDSTLNRQGVRMGSSDIYEAVERLPEVRESLVVGLELPDGGYWMPLFVVPAPGHTLDEALQARIRAVIREEVSPRHVPDEIIAAPGVPHTLTGKRIEIPVKKLLQGRALEDAVNPGSVDDLDVLRFYAEVGRSRARAQESRQADKPADKPEDRPADK